MAENKDASITIRITENQKTDLSNKAEAKGLSLSGYLSSLLIDYEKQGSRVNQSSTELAKLRLQMEASNKDSQTQADTIKYLRTELNAYNNTNFEEAYNEVKGKMVNGKLVQTKSDFVAMLAKSLDIQPQEDQTIEAKTQLQVAPAPIPPEEPKQAINPFLFWVFVGLGVITVVAVVIIFVRKYRDKEAPEPDEPQFASQSMTNAYYAPQARAMKDTQKSKSRKKR